MSELSSPTGFPDRRSNPRPLREGRVLTVDREGSPCNVSFRPLPLLLFCLENPMDGGAWKAAVHGVAKSRAQLSDFTLTFPFHALEKEMATHSSVLAWRIPGTGEPGGLPSMGPHRVGHDWSDFAAAAAVAIIYMLRTITGMRAPPPTLLLLYSSQLHV